MAEESKIDPWGPITLPTVKGKVPLDLALPPVGVTAPRLPASEEEMLAEEARLAGEQFADQGSVASFNSKWAAPPPQAAETGVAFDPTSTPWRNSLLRGTAVFPGSLGVGPAIDLGNFALNIPRYVESGVDYLGTKLRNTFHDDKIDSIFGDTASILPNVTLPGGSEDWKEWYGAPDNTPAESALGRVGQGALEWGLSSIGPGALGQLTKKGLTKLAEDPAFWREALAPRGATLPKQLAADALAGAGGGAGDYWGRELDSPVFSTVAGALGGGLAPTVGAAGRFGHNVFFGDKLQVPNTLAQTMGDNFGIPRDYQIHPDAVPFGNPNIPIDYLRGRVKGIGSRLGAREKGIQESAEKQVFLRKDAQMDESGSINDQLQRTREYQRLAKATDQASAKQPILSAEQAQLDSAMALDADNAAVAKNEASIKLSDSINQGLDDAQKLHGVALGNVAKESKVTVPGETIGAMRDRLVADWASKGEGGTPDFFRTRTGGADGTVPKGDAADDFIIDSTSPGIKKYNAVTIEQITGWDQRLRIEESNLYASGNKDTVKLAHIKQARKELDKIIESTSGNPRYREHKAAYFKHVVDRYYNDSIDPITSRTGAPAEAAGALLAAAGTKGGENAKNLLKAIGDDPKGIEHMVTYTVNDLVQYAYSPKTGKIDPNKLRAWIDKREPMLAELRKQGGNTLADKISTQVHAVHSNQKSLDAAVISAKKQSDLDIADLDALYRRKSWDAGEEASAKLRDSAGKTTDVEMAQGKRKKDAAGTTKWGMGLVNHSAARFALGNDPENAVEALLNSSDIARDANSMKRLLRKDPDALKGMQTAVYNNLLNESRTILQTGKKIDVSLDALIRPYLAVEQNGLLPPGTTVRFKAILGADYMLARVKDNLGVNVAVAQATARAGGQYGLGYAMAALLRGSKGDVDTATMRTLLMEAALDPDKFKKLMAATTTGNVNFKAVYLRTLAAQQARQEEKDKRATK